MASSVNFVGSLSQYPFYDETVQIGTRFPDPTLQLRNILKAPQSDEYIKDLATLVANRGVVFFKTQEITTEEMKELITRMGTLTGNKPKSSTLHKHPVLEIKNAFGDEVSIISSKQTFTQYNFDRMKKASRGWHTDITFERVPSDFTMLQVHTLPPTGGGDTLWASGYAAYDKLSPAYQKFLEGLTAVHNGDGFIKFAKEKGFPMQENRGSPENTGEDLTAIHPVIRTHPVTGFKSLFVNSVFTKSIVELAPDESAAVLDYLFRHVSENHDFQVRTRWEKNDVAIWDNRCTFHSATVDYDGHREGNRVVGIGEKPYFDPESKSRKRELGIA